MAAVVLMNEFLSINGTDLSNNIKGATLTLDVGEVDVTPMSTSWATLIAGVKSASLQVEFIDDFAAGETDAVLWPLFGTVVAFIVRPDAGAVSATNPNYTGSILISDHNVGGSHGSAAMKSVTYPTSGTVTRATA